MIVGVLTTVVVCLLAGFVANSNYARAAHRGIQGRHFLQSAEWPLDKTIPLPSIVFWAWERPEDLHFLDRNIAGVAFLAETISLPSNYGLSSPRFPQGFIVRPRLQPLRIAPGTPLIAVVRIEVSQGSNRNAKDNAEAPRLAFSSSPDDERQRIASEIIQLQYLPAVRGIQIDFDATQSERGFYLELLRDVRSKLPASFPVSITALASWCIGDRWLEQLPPGTIQEAVPMLFRMGPDVANVANFLRSGADFPVAACRGSLGLSTDESISHNLLAGKLAGVPLSFHQKRIYVFSPRAWTSPAANRVLKEWQP
jgi:hypothetical protein